MNGKQTLLIITAGVVFLTLFIHGCGGGDKRNVEEVIRQRVKERTDALVGNLLEDCEKDIIEIATNKADSLLIDRARRLKRLDGRPPKPSRPGEPPVKTLSAPLPLRPLFPFEIRFDTLLRDSLYQDSLRMDSLQRELIQ